MSFLAVDLQALGTRAQRQQPIAAHLQALVHRLHGVIVERIALAVLALGTPDHGFVGVGEPPAPKIRHRVGLAPDHVVKDPEAKILQRRTDPKDIVITANHPQRPFGLQHPSTLRQPGAGERIIGGEIIEPVPIIVDPIHFGVIGP